MYGVLYSEKEKAIFTTKDLTMEQFNAMMAKQREDQAEPCRKPFEKIGDYVGGSGDEADFLDTTRSIGSSKRSSVRFSEDCSIASLDSQLMSSRSETSLGSQLKNKNMENPRAGSLPSFRSPSKRSEIRSNDAGRTNGQTSYLSFKTWPSLRRKHKH